MCTKSQLKQISEKMTQCYRRIVDGTGIKFDVEVQRNSEATE